MSDRERYRSVVDEELGPDKSSKSSRFQHVLVGMNGELSSFVCEKSLSSHAKDYTDFDNVVVHMACLL